MNHQLSKGEYGKNVSFIVKRKIVINVFLSHFQTPIYQFRTFRPKKCLIS